MLKDFKKYQAQLEKIYIKLNKYKLLIFVVFVAIVFATLYLKINDLYNAQPSETAISAQNDPIKAAHVDPKVVNQLESLKNNSVSVQALFDQSRNNPFQE